MCEILVLDRTSPTLQERANASPSVRGLNGTRLSTGRLALVPTRTTGDV